MLILSLPNAEKFTSKNRDDKINVFILLLEFLFRQHHINSVCMTVNWKRDCGLTCGYSAVKYYGKMFRSSRPPKIFKGRSGIININNYYSIAVCHDI